MNRNVIATILIVLAIGIYFTVTQSVMDQAGQVQVINTQYQAAIESANKSIVALNQVISSYNNISQNDRDRLDKIVPNSVDNIRLIIDLNGVALKHGFSLQKIKTSVPDSAGTKQNPGQAVATANQSSNPGPKLDTVNIGFEVSAPYIQFKGFMQDLEADLRLLDVTSLSMAATDSGVYTYKVSLKTYWLRQQ